jgi:hypothetical protein
MDLVKNEPDCDNTHNIQQHDEQQLASVSPLTVAQT